MMSAHTDNVRTGKDMIFVWLNSIAVEIIAMHK